MAELQRAFLDSVMNAPKGSRLEIYKINAIGIRVNALKQIFPKTLTVVGDDAFEAVAIDYILGCNSKHVSLDYEGAKFSEKWTEIVSSFDVYSELQYLPDLITLERRLHHLRFANPSPPYDWADAFERTDIDTAVFALPENIAILWTDWSIITLFDCTKIHSGWLMLSLNFGQVEIKSIDPAMATFLQSTDTINVLHQSGLASDVIEKAITMGWVSSLRFPMDATC